MKKLKILIASLAVIVFAVPFAAAPAFANSMPSYEYGSTPAGVIVRNENSVLQVEKEKLTFDIEDFPGSVASMKDYKSKFTAEYTFVNPTDKVVHTGMAFPAGSIPEYNIEELNLSPEIKVDGQSVEWQIRHTSDCFGIHFDERVKNIYDDWYSDGFYSPDLPVAEYIVKVPQAKDMVRCRAKVTTDKASTRYASDSYEGDLDIFIASDVDIQNFYVLGEDAVPDLNWVVYQREILGGRGFYTRTDLKPTVIKVRETTLKELILNDPCEGTKVTDMDRYNIVVSALADDNIVASNVFTHYFNYYNCLTWYTYEVTVAPHSSIVNTVSAPILPDVSRGRYVYTYYLSPAAEWDSFGELDITINTQYTLYDDSGFEKFEGGYKASFSALPESELEFEISDGSTRNIGNNSYSEGMSALLTIILVILCLLFVGGITVAIVVPIVISRKNTKNG